jgi:PHD/YefM family antitoxin component YafN of YafNO toxin-antitoxin module
MIRSVTPDQIRNSIDELLDSVNESNDLVIIERRGESVGALVNNEELQHILGRRRAVEAWSRLDAIAEQNADLDPDEVMAIVQEEVEAVRREHYERGE